MADLVVLASGSGTNFEALAKSVRIRRHHLAALICDVPDARVLARAERLSVPSILIPYTGGRRAAEQRILETLEEYDPDLIVLAGFMRILPPAIVDRFAGAIVNIHPSILPAYPGRDAIARSFADHGTEMGITIHAVDRGVDTGPIIAQFRAERAPGSTLAEMERAVHELEHRHYPSVVADLLERINADARAGAPR